MSLKNNSANKRENFQDHATSLKAIALTATIAVLFFSIQANAYPLHKGEYLFWSQMPQSAKVLTDVQGTDDSDTAVRQTAALSLLRDLVTVNMAGKGEHYPTVHENELDTAYLHAMPKGNGNTYEIAAKALRLQADPSFVDPFLKRYFSEAAVQEIEPLVPDIEADALKQVNAVEARAKRQAVSQKAEATSAQNQSAARSAQAEAVASQLGWTDSQVETFNTIVRAYLALCAIFSILWLGRILRLFGAFRTTSDAPPQFTGPWKSLEIHSFTGYVRGAATRSDTSVSGSVRTVTGNPALGIGNRVEGRISSRTTVTNSFRLVAPRNQQEQNIELEDYHLQVWEDQVVSIAEASRGNGKWNAVIVVVNHTTGQLFFKNKNVWKIAKRGSLFWDLGFYICMVIPPVWLLGIIWGIIIQIKSSRFKSSGVQPLVEALNRKAKEFA